MAETSVDLHESKVQAIIVCNTILIVASSLGLFVRLFVRIRFLSGIALDDIFCLIAWIFTFVECLVCILMTNYGYGKHIETVTNPNDLAMFLKLDFVTELTYLWALGAIKISFCLFYLKVFPGKTFSILCWCVMGLVTAETVEETFVVIFQCSPVHKAWDATGTVPGKCLQLLSFYYISFGIRLATDIALFALPIPNLINLKMSTGKRAGLVFMFSLGILVVVTSIIRVTYLNNFSLDHTWTLVNTLNWSSVELGVAVFIACFPSFKSLITFCFPGFKRMFGLSSNRSYLAHYEMYGASGRTGDNTRRSHYNNISHVKGSQATSRTRTRVESTGNESDEHIIPSSSEGIQVRTDVTVDRLPV